MHPFISWIMAAGTIAICLATFSAASWGQERWAEISEGQPFSIGELNLQAAWVADPVDAAQWQPTEQPDLAVELAAAPKLELERIAPPPQRCWASNMPYLVPSPDGQSWQMIYPYFNGYGRAQEVVIYDFGTGEMSRQYFNQERAEFGQGIRVEFHLKPAYYAKGKLVIEMMGPLAFLVYDPAERRFVHASKPFGDDVIQGQAVLGEDGMVYGMGWEKGGGFVAYQFDPESYETKRFDAFGPANPHRQELYREVTIDGDWIYAAIGNRPWHLVAFNIRTEEGRVLGITEDIRGGGNIIDMALLQGGGISGHIMQAAEIQGIEDFDKERFNFWLRDGEIYARTGDVPPWSDVPVMRSDRVLRQYRGPNAWRGVETAVAPPQIEAEAPGIGGSVVLKYKLAGEETWHTLNYEVEMYPGDVARLMELNEDILFATDSGYGEHIFYNVRTNQLKRVEGSVSTYALGVVGENLYVSGYPSSPIYEYDLGRPLGRKQENPNPKLLGHVGQGNRIHYPMAGILGGTDGRVYTAGDSSGRQRVGGGIGWYDTRAGKADGAEIDDHRIFWGATASDDRYILLASKSDDGGELFTWDTQTHEFISQKALPFGPHPGPIVEVMPGLVIGHTNATEGEGGILYGVRPENGEVIWQKPVPAGPVTSFGDVRRHLYAFRRGPDGYIWAFFDKTLVRIDPRNGHVEPVGQVDKPADIAFAADGIYIAGGDALQRIRGVEVPSR